ncbi:MAG: hypothetical protein M5U13_06010 [Thermoanaerobaculia bacterium]|nr:hypothetical protein [Thermoanaerobaculia bacterium]
MPRPHGAQQGARQEERRAAAAGGGIDRVEAREVGVREGPGGVLRAAGQVGEEGLEEGAPSRAGQGEPGPECQLADRRRDLPGRFPLRVDRLHDLPPREPGDDQGRARQLAPLVVEAGPAQLDARRRREQGIEEERLLGVAVALRRESRQHRRQRPPQRVGEERVLGDRPREAPLGEPQEEEVVESDAAGGRHVEQLNAAAGPAQRVRTRAAEGPVQEHRQLPPLELEARREVGERPLDSLGQLRRAPTVGAGVEPGREGAEPVGVKAGRCPLRPGVEEVDQLADFVPQGLQGGPRHPPARELSSLLRRLLRSPALILVRLAVPFDAAGRAGLAQWQKELASGHEPREVETGDALQARRSEHVERQPQLQRIAVAGSAEPEPAIDRGLLPPVEQLAEGGEETGGLRGERARTRTGEGDSEVGPLFAEEAGVGIEPPDHDADPLRDDALREQGEGAVTSGPHLLARI